MIQAGSTHAQFACLSPQTLAKGSIHHLADFLNPLPVTLHVMQPERQGRFVDITQHVAEERFMVFTTDTQARLSHVVAVRHRGRQLITKAGHEGFDFRRHDPQGSGIVDHMVEQQHAQPAIIGRIMGVTDAHHRGLADIQAVMTRVEHFTQLLSDIAGSRIEKNFLRNQLRMTPDHLHRIVQTLPKHTRAQNVMPRHHTLQGRSKFMDTLQAVKSEQRILQVGIALDRSQVVIKNPFLQRSQCVDILNIGDTARHTGHYTVDGLLIQIR
ncbi:hypothetical protein PSCICJ_04220 [Pseudomonas cichorii]|nr:hypothetical protein PSCICJ_04220 [Pseudomonas cichorii]